MAKDAVVSFKSGHQEIVGIIAQMQSALRSYPEAKPSIRKMNEILLAHLGRQDNIFFDKLNSFYQSDRQAIKMIEFLIHDLKDMKIKFLIFFDEYSGEMADRGSKNFPRDFTQFSSDVLGRIKIEEEYLFPLLEKLSAA